MALADCIVLSSPSKYPVMMGNIQIDSMPATLGVDDFRIYLTM